jgi:hypothetical protein
LYDIIRWNDGWIGVSAGPKVAAPDYLASFKDVNISPAISSTSGIVRFVSSYTSQLPVPMAALIESSKNLR